MITYVPLDLTGEPFLVLTEAGLFLREKLGFDQKEINKLYKISIE